MGRLVAAGGIVVAANSLKAFEIDVQSVCGKAEYLIPDDENTKWSPNKDSWLRANLERDVRNLLYADLLDCAADHKVRIIVAISDQNCAMANLCASDHEMDAMLLALERFDTLLGNSAGMAFLPKPSGGSTDERKFIEECIQHRKTGTQYVKFDSLASNPQIVPAKQSRMLQIADLAVSITNAKVAGGDAYASSLFGRVLDLMPCTSKGVKGGLGLKIHPSLRYRNLYHWVLDDDYFVRGNSGFPFPLKDSPYSSNEMDWS